MAHTLQFRANGICKKSQGSLFDISAWLPGCFGSMTSSFQGYLENGICHRNFWMDKLTSHTKLPVAISQIHEFQFHCVPFQEIPLRPYPTHPISFAMGACHAMCGKNCDKAREEFVWSCCEEYPHPDMESSVASMSGVIAIPANMYSTKAPLWRMGELFELGGIWAYNICIYIYTHIHVNDIHIISIWCMLMYVYMFIYIYTVHIEFIFDFAEITKPLSLVAWPFMILSGTAQESLEMGIFSCPEQDALFNCLQGRWFCKDNSAVADIIGQVIVWDGGGTTLLHQRGNNTVWLKVGTFFFGLRITGWQLSFLMKMLEALPRNSRVGWYTLPKSSRLKMIFLFPRWGMLVPLQKSFWSFCDVFVGFGSMANPPHPFRWNTRSILGRSTGPHRLPFHGMMAKFG